jgi:exopolysaccharide biosynthesis WecB/TagA/CpsF family protein
MVDTLALAAVRGVSVFLYGGRTDTLQQLQLALQQRWPALRVAGAISPPFRPPGAAEIAADVEAINRSGAGIVWVGLGCPKQERWMAERHGQVQAVMVGVGAAFDFLAGQTPRAPSWMRRHGLEWLHRLAPGPPSGGRCLSTTPLVLGALRRCCARERERSADRATGSCWCTTATSSGAKTRWSTPPIAAASRPPGRTLRATQRQWHRCAAAAGRRAVVDAHPARPAGGGRFAPTCCTCTTAFR